MSFQAHRRRPAFLEFQPRWQRAQRARLPISRNDDDAGSPSAGSASFLPRSSSWNRRCRYSGSAANAHFHRRRSSSSAPRRAHRVYDKRTCTQLEHWPVYPAAHLRRKRHTHVTLRRDHPQRANLSQVKVIGEGVEQAGQAGHEDEIRPGTPPPCLQPAPRWRSQPRCDQRAWPTMPNRV